MGLKTSARLSLLLLSLASTVILGACSVRTPEHLANVPAGTGAGGTGQTAAARMGERYDADAEEEIASQSLKAWRTAIAHAKKPAEQAVGDWQKQRVQDEKAAMDQLSSLSKRHPSSSTVYLMMGQVEEHFGKRQAAIDFLKVATRENTVNSISVFKLAENQRKTGDLTAAAEQYRRLLKSQPDFYLAQLGLAQCLVKKDPAQAQHLAEGILAAKQADEVTIKQAQEIVSETKGRKASP